MLTLTLTLFYVEKSSVSHKAVDDMSASFEVLFCKKKSSIFVAIGEEGVIRPS
jgi:hypothetical protein